MFVHVQVCADQPTVSGGFLLRVSVGRDGHSLGCDDPRLHVPLPETEYVRPMRIPWRPNGTLAPWHDAGSPRHAYSSGAAIAAAAGFRGPHRPGQPERVVCPPQHIFTSEISPGWRTNCSAARAGLLGASATIVGARRAAIRVPYPRECGRPQPRVSRCPDTVVLRRFWGRHRPSTAMQSRPARLGSQASPGA